ncbi:5-bromo-4-chloroindolyl phosphate hydrolysis family protein [Escherichia albertii]|uniref:5-bromo-4-chloroindolyl phosphate hydrolysis family protein n=1 Tax=Escherichia albertii TaxID=208962 RepID=UPI0007439EFB|nr:5-bromo-4-chloroindolyl phosphate hydrolysis family protein [Escherichia albertii]
MTQDFKAQLKVWALIFISLCVAIAYVNYFLISPKTLLTLFEEEPRVIASLIICLWISFFILFYNSRLSYELYFAVAIGGIWLLFGLAVLVPFWVAFMYAFVTSVFESQKKASLNDDLWLLIKVILMIAICILYSQGFSLLDSPSFLAIFVIGGLLFIGLLDKYAKKPVDSLEKTISSPQNSELSYKNTRAMLDRLDKTCLSLQASTIRNQLGVIISCGKRIMQSMDDDAKDIPSGCAFLERYLPYVQKIVDNQLRMQRQQHVDFNADQQMDKALSELIAAFEQQYVVLQQNNQLELTVELDVLNSLLKIDGFK